MGSFKRSSFHNAFIPVVRRSPFFPHSYFLFCTADNVEVHSIRRASMEQASEEVDAATEHLRQFSLT
jgi:hypothetical protein